MKILSTILLIILMVTSCNSDIEMNEKYVVEFIGSNLDVEEVRNLASEHGGATDTELYRWKNHLAIYSSFDDVDSFIDQVISKSTETKIKLYKDPFYSFKNREHCEKCTVAKSWKHILLTANLVDDNEKQAEYLEYHRTQFEKWPEVAKGFCNAGFQELNVYLNDRQLMLIISIPADKTLAEIDPKTVDNNPRGAEWNTIMSGFQEGIEGTKPSETWVFLDVVE